MDEKPRNLKAMTSEANDTSEIMIDLADAALFFSNAGVDIAGIVTRGPARSDLDRAVDVLVEMKNVSTTAWSKTTTRDRST